MAQTIAEIKKVMTDRFINDPAVIEAYDLRPGKTFEDEFSAASIESIIFYIAAFCAWVLQMLFDTHTAEIDDKIRRLKPGTLVWYAEKLKTFQYGDDLVPETDYYDNTGLTDEQIAERKVIKYAAAIEQAFSNGRFGIRAKVAGEVNGQRQALSPAQLDAAKEFASRFRFAGVYLEVTSDPADYLTLSLRVYYNPLVLNNQGQRLDGTDNTPLQTAIDEHLKNLPFNGRFNLTSLVDAMQKVNGVADPRILSAQTKYAATAYTEVIDERIPNSGYLKIYNPADLSIEWLPYNG